MSKAIEDAALGLREAQNEERTARAVHAEAEANVEKTRASLSVALTRLNDAKRKLDRAIEEFARSDR